MNKEPSAAAADTHSEGFKRLLPIAHAVVLAFVLLGTGVVATLVYSLRSDVAALEAQARNSAKATKAVRAELAAVEASLDEAKPEPAPIGAAAAAPAVAQRAPGPLLVGYGGGAHSGKAGTPIPVCVFQSGDPHGLADCIKRSTARKNRS